MPARERLLPLAALIVLAVLSILVIATSRSLALGDAAADRDFVQELRSGGQISLDRDTRS